MKIMTSKRNEGGGAWSEVLRNRRKELGVASIAGIIILSSIFHVVSDNKAKHAQQEEANNILREEVLTQFFNAHGGPTNKFQVAMRRAVYEKTPCSRIKEAHELNAEKEFFFEQCDNLKEQISNFLHDPK